MAPRIRTGLLGLAVVVAALGLQPTARAEATPDTAGPRSTRGSDFNGDGYDDLAVASGYDPDDDAIAAIRVHYGSRDGLVATRSQALVASELFPRRPGQRVGFDEETAVGDFDDDGFDDLAIGASNSRIGRRAMAGAVVVVYGSTDGLDARRRLLLTQNSPGMAGTAERGDRFGTALTVGDFGRGAADDLAIGTPYESLNGSPTSGGVHVVYGGTRGLDPRASQVWRENTPGIEGRVGASDGFGEILAAGNLGGSRYDDLVIGSPTDHFHDQWEHGNGTIHVLYGSAAGLRVRGAQRFSSYGPGVDHGPEAETGGFVEGLAIGYFRGGEYADLVVTSSSRPGSDLWTDGSVTVWFGSASGLTRRRQVWSQASYGIAGQPEEDDHFGYELAVGNFGHDLDGAPFDDLAVSVNEGPGYDVGAVHVIFGGPLGLTGASSQFFDQRTPGVAGVRDDFDEFGSTLVAADLGRNADRASFDDLLVGVPDDGPDEFGTFTVLYGAQSGLRARGSQTFRADR